MDMVILFDNRSINWDENTDFNTLYVKAQMQNMADILKERHWLYLREVFHMLGLDALNISPIMGWNGENAVLEYSIDEPDENGFIKIHHNAKAIA